MTADLPCAICADPPPPPPEPARCPVCGYLYTAIGHRLKCGAAQK